MMVDTNAPNTELLDPSSFSLPEDFDENPDDYEIWSVRAPVKFDMATLNGVSLQFELETERKFGLEPNITSFQVHGDSYSLSQGHTAEVSSFRILKANDTEEEKGMSPLPVTFDRHLNLIKSTNSKVADIDIAPSNERAPKVDFDEIQMRVPYTPIDQKSGLKRRWNMMGANTKSTSDSLTDEQLEIPNRGKKFKKKKQKKSKKSKKSVQ